MVNYSKTLLYSNRLYLTHTNLHPLFITDWNHCFEMMTEKLINFQKQKKNETKPNKAKITRKKKEIARANNNHQ